MQTIHHLIQLSLSYTHQHPLIGQFFAFIAAFLESLPIVGTLIPGSIIMTGVGTLIGTGTLPGILTLFYVSLGAFIGDLIGFYCGYALKDRIHSYWPFRKYPKILQKSEQFFHQHGGKSIIIGRFVGPARSTIPMVAGLMRMRCSTFIFAAIPSAILWGVAYTIPGILIGALATELPAKKMTEAIAIGFGIIILGWALFICIKHSSRWLITTCNQLISKLWQWMSTHHRAHCIIKWITNQQQPSDHRQLSRLVLAVLSAALFLICYLSTILHTSITALNLPWFHLLQSIRSQPLDTFFIIISFMGKPIVILIASLLISTILFLKQQHRTAYHFIGLIVTASASIVLLKHVFYFPRPSGFNYFDPSSSLPSGHTCLSLCFYGYLALLTNQINNKAPRWLSYSIAVTLISLVSISRLYLGMHWLTDILCSLLLGSMLLLATCISTFRLPTPNAMLQLKLFTWLSIIFASTLLVTSVYAVSHFNISRYQHSTVNQIKK